MTPIPINDDGDIGSMHNGVLKGKYKKLNSASTNAVIMEHNTPHTESTCSLDNTTHESYPSHTLQCTHYKQLLHD
jgi:hypothetical protein